MFMFMNREDVSRLSDEQLLISTAAACAREHASTVDVVRHLMEVERRKLYLLQACSTLSAYAKQLGLSKDAARKRVKVARIATFIPQVFDELEQRRVHLTVLYMLARVLTPKNARGLLTAARARAATKRRC